MKNLSGFAISNEFVRIERNSKIEIVVYHDLNNYCTIDLGAFYLDVIKDRQYTTRADSIARRSTQTAMYFIAEALVRWLAPILSFTAEEIWRNLPGERAESVFLETWFELPDMFLPGEVASDQFGLSYWQDVLAGVIITLLIGEFVIRFSENHRTR